MSNPPRATFVSSATKNTAATALWTTIKANLRSDLAVDGSGNPRSRLSTSGTFYSTVTSWVTADVLNGANYELKLPLANMVSDFSAVMTTLSGLATPPNGFAAEPAKDTPSDPSYQFNATDAGLFSWAFPYINLMHQADQITTDTNVRHVTLVDDGNINSSGDIVSLPAGAANITMYVNTPTSSTAEMQAAFAKQFSLICGAGDAQFSLGGWGNIAGSAGNRTADFDATGNKRILFTGAASDIYCGRTDLYNLHKAGAVFSPNYARAHRIPRILRFMDFNGTNDSPVSDYADISPEAQYYWAMSTAFGTWAKYRTPPVSVMIRMCNEFKCDMHYCIPHLATDTFINTVAAEIRDGLDPDLRCYFEYSNETWNQTYPFVTWLYLNLTGIDLYNKATVSTAGSSYTAGDEVTGGGWTVRIDTVSAGVPQTFTVIARSAVSATSAVAMSGGTGTGLELDFTNFVSNTDFPYQLMHGFTVARVAGLLKTVYSSNWGTKGQMLHGIQSRDDSKTGAFIIGVNNYLDGMSGHPDYGSASGDAFTDLVHGASGATYHGPQVIGATLTSVEGWLATSQQTLNDNFPALASTEMLTNISELNGSKTAFAAEGVKMGPPYEGGWHCNISQSEAQATIDAMAAYRKSDEGIAKRTSVEIEYQDIFGPIMSQLAVIGTPTQGNPWYLLDSYNDFGGSRWTYVETYNATYAGSDWDTGRTTDFAVGPYFGVIDYDGDVGGSTLPVMVGGHGSYFYGDGTNVAVMPLPGICTDVDTAIIPYTAAAYTIETGPNGCKQFVHSSHALPWRFNPDEVTTIVFMGDGAFSALSAL